MAPTEKVKKPEEKGKKKRKHVLNSYLGGGIMRYSRSQMYKRRGLYRLKGVKRPITKKEKKPIMKVKKIGGEKNGGTRVVFLKKSKANYPTKKAIRKRGPRAMFSMHKRYTRKSLKPGRVLILLAGRHQGKRVVLLKVLKSGLLLVNGPFCVNACPMRRISQRYVIACQTRINLTGVKLPPHVNDKYFRRVKDKKKPAEGDIFVPQKRKFVPDEQRKADQKLVDEACLKAIKKYKDSKFLVKYLKNMFAVHSTQYPHRMKF
uniref:Large ribosomal subunit protein eL6 n=1 Tax=Tabanus bromius TaxID=304241 RepID=A0A0K8TPQ7_TABBR